MTSIHRDHFSCHRSFAGALTLALAALFLASGALAQAPDAHQHENRNFDARADRVTALKAQPSPAQRAAEASLANAAPSLAVDYDAMTGAARNVRSHTG